MDAYAVLGVQEGADRGQIKAAYRRAARAWHPDRHARKPTYQEAVRRMQEINEAYDFLMKQAARGNARGGPSYTPEDVLQGARALLDQGRADEALRFLLAHPLHTAPWYRLVGGARLALGQDVPAQDAFRWAMRRDPSDAASAAMYRQLRRKLQPSWYRRLARALRRLFR